MHINKRQQKSRDPSPVGFGGGGSGGKSMKTRNNELVKANEAKDPQEVIKKAHKLIVFMLGGLSYTEIRAIRNWESKFNKGVIVILGASHVMSPSE